MGCCFVILDITFLTGDDLFMKLVAAVVELVCLPVSQKHFTAANLCTERVSSNLIKHICKSIVVHCTTMIVSQQT